LVSNEEVIGSRVFRACSRGKKRRNCCGRNEFGGLHCDGVLMLQPVWLLHGVILILMLGWLYLYYREIFINVGRSALLWNFDISVGRAAQKIACRATWNLGTREEFA
jgi:hypothetical protein